MNLDLILLLLRFIGALALILFVAAIAWLIYRDMQVTAASLAQQSKPVGKIQLLSNGADGTSSFSLLPVTTIGRSATNLIVLDDEFASNEHALLIRRGEQWWLEDLGSRNGTMLNDTPLVDTAVVSPSDIITIGNSRLKIETS